MRIRAEFEIRRTGDTGLILRREQDGCPAKVVFVLNETGEFLWKCLEQGQSEEEMFALLAQEYEIAGEQEEAIRQDIAEFLQELRSIGVLEEE